MQLLIHTWQELLFTQLGRQKWMCFSTNAISEKSSLSENIAHIKSLISTHIDLIFQEYKDINFQTKQDKIKFDYIFLHLSV